MAANKPFKITFTLDDADVAYFRGLYRKAKAEAKNLSQDKIIEEVRDVIRKVRSAKKTPSFVREAVDTLEQLGLVVRDEEYALPAKEREGILAALAYFANPEDLIPDHIPGLGFLDDALMIQIMSEEFKHELWGYAKFRTYRETIEQRPWTQVAGERSAPKLVAKRQQIRGQVAERKARAKDRKRSIW